MSAVSLAWSFTLAATPLLTSYVATLAATPLLTSYIANVSTRSASPYGQNYTAGIQAFDVTTGHVMRNISMEVPQKGHSFYLRLCDQNVSYYFDSFSEGTCKAKASPKACTCVVWGKHCKEWAPAVFPTQIPDDSRKTRSNLTVDGVAVDQYDWVVTPFGPVTAYVSAGEPRAIIRFVMSRVQTDYRLLNGGKPPAASVFDIPPACKHAVPS